MHHGTTQVEHDDHDTEIPSQAIATLLLNLCKHIQSLAGPKYNREWREWQQSQSSPLDVSLNDRADTARRGLNVILTAFAEIVGQDVIDGLVKVRGITPESSRDAVLSWADLLSPLVQRSHVSDTVRYTPRDLREALTAIRHEVLRDALWAPEKVRSEHNQSVLLLDRVLALALARFLKRSGHDLHLVQETIAKAFHSDWDTMRRWEKMGRQGLGDDQVNAIFAAADAGQLYPDTQWALAESFIQVAGTAFSRRTGHSNLSEMTSAEELQRVLDGIRSSAVDPTNSVT